MNEIIGVLFDNTEKIKYFYTNGLKLKKNITVITNFDGGQRFGKVVTDVHPIDSKKLTKSLGKIIRIATSEDYHNNQKNKKDAKKALKKCEDLAVKYNLDIKLVDAYFTHDRDQLIFKFVSDVRIDFRDLAKELANIFHTRIELRQMGVRDKAQEISGLGSCGQKLCCSRFLDEFNSVSISMAKNQNLALNPSKINGLCGRLLCCLNYEDECYKECRKNLPKIGQTVTTSTGKEGKVVSLDILKQKYSVETSTGIVEESLNGSN